jgi:hypothetical protein
MKTMIVGTQTMRMMIVGDGDSRNSDDEDDGKEEDIYK